MSSSSSPSPTTEAKTPLLPETTTASEVSIKPASISSAVFNVSTTMVGAGIMAIPATLKVLGVIPAFVLIVVVAWLAEISVEFLLRFTRAGETSSYAGVMEESFGRLGSVAIQIAVLVTNLGCLIVYLIIIGDVLSGSKHEGTIHLGILEEWFGSHWWNSRVFALLIIVVFIMLPLVLLRRVESLKFSSAIAVLLAVMFVAICSVMAISAFLRGETKSPNLFPQLSNNSSFFNLFTAVPVIVTAFTFHFNVHPIGFELGKTSDMISATRISLVLCAATYFAIGLFGYLLFGESIMADILVNFDQHSGSEIGALLNNIIRLSYVLHLMLVFPLLNFSLRVNIDGLFFRKKKLLAEDSNRFLLLTVILLAFTYLAAIAIPSIWAFFQLVGSTSAVCIAFIFPGAIVLRDVHGISTTKDKIMATTIVILAVVTSTIAISTNIFNLTGNKS
ncbi:hypothetical protein ACFE04_017720 [Oxalis oulophora]